MHYEIKKLGTNDVALAQELFILFKKVFNEGDIHSSDVQDDAYIKTLLEKKDFHVFVAIADDNVIGGLTAYEFPMYLKKEKEMYLYDLAVDENHRRKGAAKSLIQGLKEYAQQNDVATIFIEANIGDTEAIEFYKSINADMEEVKHFNIVVK